MGTHLQALPVEQDAMVEAALRGEVAFETLDDDQQEKFVLRLVDAPQSPSEVAFWAERAKRGGVGMDEEGNLVIQAPRE